MEQLNYKCPKCSNTEYEIGELLAANGFLSKMFDLQNKPFTTVTCARCKYIEFYNAKSSSLGEIFDSFTDQKILERDIIIFGQIQQKCPKGARPRTPYSRKEFGFILAVCWGCHQHTLKKYYEKKE